jgi:formate-dependent nitrite reductase cytochrome c552 subunit
MKTRGLKYTLSGIAAALLLILPVAAVGAGSEGVTETYKQATAPFDDEALVGSVHPLPVDAVLAKSGYQGGRFWTRTRKDKIQRFKCSQCHNNKDAQILQAAEMAHGDITLVHGGKQKPLNCFTCHKKDERDFLVVEKGTRVDMDHSYQLCGQCHFRQKSDWVGGAHGKRISHWAGKRVITNCTTCHDPHSPRFQKRWPRTYSRPLTK